MSRIGGRVIYIPDGVTTAIAGSEFKATGPKGELTHQIPDNLEIKVEGNQLWVKRLNETKTVRSLHGTTARIIANILTGVSTGFERKLDYKGVGFTIVVENGKMNMRLGFSHPVILDIPEGVDVSVAKNSIVLTGIDKEKLGAFAAKLRETKKPEVYKGKGIKYHEEIIKKKAGKTAQSA